MNSHSQSSSLSIYGLVIKNWEFELELEENAIRCAGKNFSEILIVYFHMVSNFTDFNEVIDFICLHRPSYSKSSNHKSCQGFRLFVVWTNSEFLIRLVFWLLLKIHILFLHNQGGFFAVPVKRRSISSIILLKPGKQAN